MKKPSFLFYALFCGAALALVTSDRPGHTASVVPRSQSSDGSIATIVGGKMSVSGLVNALTFAQGIAIGDGATHTVGTAPTGTCFHGKTTLAGLVAACRDIANIASPFYFLTDSGAITGPLCSAGATVNCFTAAKGAWKLTNMSVANMDIAWLAIQAAMLTRGAYIPSGNYVIGSSEALPLMVPVSSQFNLQAHGSVVLGDGPTSSILMAGSSFGTLGDPANTVIPLVSCGDAGATPTNVLGRWNGGNGTCVGRFSEISLYGNPRLATGLASGYQTDGLGWGARLAIDDVYVTSFLHNVTITGDHTLFKNLQSHDGVYGLYWTAPNTALTGDLAFSNMSSSGASFAAIDVDGNASVAGTTFDGETYINAGLYDIYGETNGCADILFDVHFARLMTEYSALGVIEDGHNFSSGIYTDSNKCRGAHGLIIERWFNQFNNNNITSQSGPSTTWRRRRATIDVNQLSGKLMGLSVTGGGFIPTADIVGPAGIAMINAQSIEDTSYGIYLTLEGDLPNIFLEGVGAGAGGGTVPVLNAVPGGNGYLPADGVQWSAPGGLRGIFGMLLATGTYTSTTAGDVMENASPSYNYVTPGGANADQPVVGIAAQSGLTSGQAVPLATTGEYLVATGYHTGGDGYEMKSTGIGGRTRFVAGTGGTDGTYSITATGGGCTTEPIFSATVSGGGISAVTATNSAAVSGCSSAPTVSTAGITGLLAGSITPQWPSANAVAAANQQSGVILGYGKTVHAGNMTLGTATYYTKLTGM